MDSRYLSYLLRHHPEDKNLKLDEYGWCRVSDLLAALNISRRELDQMVKNNTRYLYSEDGQFIKAAHGHSIPIKYTNEQMPPDILYHGTALRWKDKILAEGLKKMSRGAVHLSTGYDVAEEVGCRHANKDKERIYVFEVNAKQMYKDGFKFYQSEDGVWLTDFVPSKYLN